MNRIRRVDPVARKQAELNLVRQLAEIALLAGIRQCEDLADVAHVRRYHHGQEPSPVLRCRTSSHEAAAETSLPFPTDEELAESARMAVARHGVGRDAPITVTAINGWLILEGEVESAHLRHELETVVRGLNGITGVSNRVILANDALAQRVQQKIVDAFLADARAQAFRVQVSAVEQTVVLSGSARSEVERDQAVTAAWQVPGTEVVVNEIQLSAIQATAAGTNVPAYSRLQ